MDILFTLRGLFFILGAKNKEDQYVSFLPFSFFKEYIHSQPNTTFRFAFPLFASTNSLKTKICEVWSYETQPKWTGMRCLRSSGQEWMVRNKDYFTKLNNLFLFFFFFLIMGIVLPDSIRNYCSGVQTK